MTLPNRPQFNWVRGKTADITDTTDTSVIAATTGAQTHITNVIIQNSNATTATWVKLRCAATDVMTFYCPAAGGGISVAFDPPLAGSTSGAWSVQAETTAANIRANLSGYKVSG